jgi:hypothetical protein
MGLLEIVGLIGGILKFWDQVTWIVRTLQGTPEEHRQAIVESMQKEAEAYAKTGRPHWD